MTGMVSPPSGLPCYAHDNGGCRHAQDRCLFSHRNASSQHYRLRECCEYNVGPSHLMRSNGSTDPQLALRDVPIAEAATKAGFDGSSWSKLRNLINAVRRAALPTYPDYWSDPSAWTPSIPPERYHAEQQRARKGVAQAYKDVGIAHRAAIVPAFVVPANQLIDNIRNDSQKTDRVSSIGCKRGHEDFIDLTQDARKRLKTEGPSYSQGPKDNRTSDYIDLTQEKPMETAAQRRATNRPALGDISNNNTSRPGAGKKLTKKQRKRAQDQRYNPVPVLQEDRTNDNPQQTAAIMAKIASGLHAIAATIDEDRDTLRERWEDDDQLKHPDVTKDLAELNECFSHAQEAVMDGISIIKESLLKSR